MDNIEQALSLLCSVGNSIHQINKKTEKHCGVSLVQWFLLKNLVNMPGSSALQLSKAVGVHPSTLTQTLKRLEKKEFIFVTEDPKDSRKKLIVITRAGRKLLEDAAAEFKPWLYTVVPVVQELQLINKQLRSSSTLINLPTSRARL